MEKGYLGEFLVYQLNNGKILLVDPSDEISANFELFKGQSSEINENSFKGIKSIILKSNEKLSPVKIDENSGFFEGLYYKVT